VRRAAEVAKTALRAARQKAMKKAKAMPSKDDVSAVELLPEAYCLTKQLNTKLLEMPRRRRKLKRCHPRMA
jgi:5-bromo-4-chloroindolyl phosphate hydrolysis protein